jgi:hypothetical protein
MWDSFRQSHICDDPVIINRCEIFRNVYALAVNLFMAYGILNYSIFAIDQPILYTCDVLYTHLIIDIFFLENSYVYIHHFIGIVAIVLYQSFEIADADFQQSAAVLFSLEISSVFLCAREIMRRMEWTTLYPTIYVWNNICFALSFFWTRIFYYMYYFFYSNYFVRDLQQFDVSIWNIYLSYGLLYGLFGLNIYWGILILKHLVKNAIHNKE